MSTVRTLLARRRTLRAEVPASALVMGILNRTPDSFTDGGQFEGEGAARARARQMIEEGADIIDVGAESTRPGAPTVPAAEQIARIGGVIGELAADGVVVSIDTTSPEVAAHALDQGARIINSVSLEPAGELAELARDRGADLVLMHCRGSMTDMAGFSVYPDGAYGDVVADVAREWTAAADVALGRGLDRSRLVLDPGLGFAKNARQSRVLCARLAELVALGFPVLVGPSRKSFVAPGTSPADRLGGSIAAAIACVAAGAEIVRVHDVAATRQALAVWSTITDLRPNRRSGMADSRPRQGAADA